MDTMGAMKKDEMTPYLNITILFVKFSGEIVECFNDGKSRTNARRSAV
jgi:hypothetical protein